MPPKKTEVEDDYVSLDQMNKLLRQQKDIPTTATKKLSQGF